MLASFLKGMCAGALHRHIPRRRADFPCTGCGLWHKACINTDRSSGNTRKITHDIPGDLLHKSHRTCERRQDNAKMVFLDRFDSPGNPRGWLHRVHIRCRWPQRRWPWLLGPWWRPWLLGSWLLGSWLFWSRLLGPWWRLAWLLGRSPNLRLGGSPLFLLALDSADTATAGPRTGSGAYA